MKIQYIFLLLISFLVHHSSFGMAGEITAQNGTFVLCDNALSGRVYRSANEYHMYEWTVTGGSISGDNDSRSVTVNWTYNETYRGPYKIELEVFTCPGPPDPDGNVAASNILSGTEFDCQNRESEGEFDEDLSVITGGTLSISGKSSEDVCLGGDANFTASIGDGASFSKWEKYNANNDTWVLVTGATSSTLTLSNIQSASTHRVVANAANDCGVLTKKVYVSIKDPVETGFMLGERTVYKGDATGTIEILESGGTIDHWERKVGEAQFENIGNAGLTVLNYNREFNERTEYKVLLDGGCGEVESDIAVIDVIAQQPHWILSQAMDNTGIYAEGKTYFNYRGELLQSQVKNITESQVMASQPVSDRYDRDVISTLSAPINRNSFEYQPNFIAESSTGAPYDYQHFDLDANRYNPDRIEDSNIGTLGWYYSTNNTMEDNVPITQYPYSRVEFYDDGTGQVKRSASPGETLRLNSGREVYSRDFEVSTELDKYVDIRNKILKLAGGPSSMRGEAVQSVTIDPNGNMAVSFADKSGNVLMTAREGDWLNPSPVFNLKEGTSTFYVMHFDENVQLSQSIDVVNVKTGFTWFSLQQGDLEAGFWTVESSSNNLTVSLSHGFGDISFNFYDDAGRLVVSIAPNGVEMILKSPNGIDDFDVENLPFANYYHYNHQGWLLSTVEPDAGTSKFRYRKDGSIRYSQNQKQEAGMDFSYTDYDALGRPVESGEIDIVPDNNSVTLDFEAINPDANPTVEELLSVFNDLLPGYSATKREWVKTYYDVEASDFNTETGLGGNYKQDFVMGSVSWTENENIKTWYSYDEQGRVTWMAQKPLGLMTIAFVMEYEYDFLGNVLSMAYKSYDNGVLKDQFYHHYTYDADKRLSTASTSLDGNLSQATLQARYLYYLHGPLKRVELATDLQGIDFVYNINGWLKSINHPDNTLDPGGDGPGNGFQKDAFGMILNYYENDLNSLFQVSSLGNRPDPFKFHGLDENDFEPIRIAKIFDVFAPYKELHKTTEFKKYSAESPLYKNQLKELYQTHSKE